ncbi:glycosyltransferase family 2 protein [Lichenifustis flavocetrariae]|uniref:Glycosyltransferase family 2 protein n=1 Tax=Lichenifustis flavocetrariae TaxID=2949735 RepID=A0AA42CLA8_9HYPH|nr:glycosyltransferase family 2 protein [Lichenifustis flavocetrariae]MCW6511419.1 glycosyltransferase family 2 protein [Lichenifustis flavocetrariae]
MRLLYWLLTPHRLPMRLQILRRMNRRNRIGVWTNIQRIMLNAPTVSPRDRTNDQAYGRWVKQLDRLTAADRGAIKEHVARLEYRPKISIIVPVYNTPESVLTSTVQSVFDQLYPDWELCIVDDGSTEPHIAKLFDRFAEADARVKHLHRQENGHIAAASNSALGLATGAFVALLDHDDLLAEQALYEIAVELNVHPAADIVFSDEDKIDENGRRYDPYFKSDFSLDLLLGQNMFNHLTVYRKSLVDSVGGFRPGFEGSQDYDLALRIVAMTTPEKIRHIPAVLYHWRQTSGGESFSQAYLDRCIQSAQRAVAEFLNRDGANPIATVGRVSEHVPWNRVRWVLCQPEPLVSILIPTRDRADLMRQCLEGLLKRTAYGRFEVIIVDNGSVERETHDLFAELTLDPRVRVLSQAGPFNYSALNNAAAREAQGEILLLLNNDIDVIKPDWLLEMVSLLQRADVGVVGAKLIYADTRIQHAGVRLGAGTFEGGPGIAGHFGWFQDRDDLGYFGSLALARDVSAVTGACLAVRRNLYEQVGGLEADHLGVAFNDIDLCLKVRAAGYKVIWTPFAELYHLESASRGSDLAGEKMDRFHGECRFMRDKWGDLLQRDPFYNPAFDNYDNDYRLSFQPQRQKPWKV